MSATPQAHEIADRDKALSARIAAELAATPAPRRSEGPCRVVTFTRSKVMR